MFENLITLGYQLCMDHVEVTTPTTQWFTIREKYSFLRQITSATSIPLVFFTPRSGLKNQLFWGYTHFAVVCWNQLWGKKSPDLQCLVFPCCKYSHHGWFQATFNKCHKWLAKFLEILQPTLIHHWHMVLLKQNSSDLRAPVLFTFYWPQRVFFTSLFSMN